MILIKETLFLWKIIAKKGRITIEFPFPTPAYPSSPPHRLVKTTIPEVFCERIYRGEGNPHCQLYHRGERHGEANGYGNHCFYTTSVRYGFNFLLCRVLHWKAAFPHSIHPVFSHWKWRIPYMDKESCTYPETSCHIHPNMPIAISR